MSGPVLNDRGWNTAIHAGEAALFGVMAAVVATLPAGVRLANGGASFWVAWVTAAGLLAMPFVVSVGIGRSARRAWRDFTKGQSEPLVLTIVLWVALVIPSFVVVGAALHANTHHRGLGGATFGVMTLGIAVFYAVIAWRVVELAARFSRQIQRRAVLGLAGALFALSLLTPVGRPLAGVAAELKTMPADEQALIVDGLLALVVVVLTTALDLPPRTRKVWAITGALAMATLTVTGIVVSTAQGAAILASLPRRAPVVGVAAGALGFDQARPSPPSGASRQDVP